MYIDGKKKPYKVSPNKIMLQYFEKRADSVMVKSFLQKSNVFSKKFTKVILPE